MSFLPHQIKDEPLADKPTQSLSFLAAQLWHTIF